MINVEVDTLGTGILAPVPGTVAVESPALTWPEDRYVIGWEPWIGFGGNTICESHLILNAGGTNLFLRGPHKESGGQMYDETGAEFFPAGHGRFVPKSTPVTLQFLVYNTGYPGTPRGGQANARIFSVKV